VRIENVSGVKRYVREGQEVMSTAQSARREHIFESLRKGLVPERGIEAFAQGIERQRSEVHRQLDLAASGEGTIKFLRGGYGCGKTFMASLAVLDAQARRASRPRSWSSPTTTCDSTASTMCTAR
jgi:hypothetical protein